MKCNWLKIGLALSLGLFLLLEVVISAESTHFTNESTSITNLPADNPLHSVPVTPSSMTEEDSASAELPQLISISGINVLTGDISIWKSHGVGNDYLNRLERPPRPVCC